MFKLRMTGQLEEAFGKVIEHQAKRGRPSQARRPSGERLGR